MTFRSILFPDSARVDKSLDEPKFFADLKLDQIVKAITTGKEQYDLKPFFCRSLESVDAIEYRQEIMVDVESPVLAGYVASFTQAMERMRAHLAQVEKLYYAHQKQAWFVDAAEVYRNALCRFDQDLSSADLRSRGLIEFRKFLAAYIGSPQFTMLSAQFNELKSALGGVTYCVLIDASSLTVRKYESEPDLGVEIQDTFARFKRTSEKDYNIDLPDQPGMDHIEAEILQRVAKLFPDVFKTLEDFWIKNRNCFDETLIRFDREIQFYVSYLEYIAQFKRAGLKFCYPEVSENKSIYGRDGFDLALAGSLLAENKSIICNDFQMQGYERIFAVTGANQGGKTTFARMFGQLHFLANIGCPVPGGSARLFLFDRIFTHFEREERIATLRGKLQDDLIRAHDILQQATARSILIINEIFTSTSIADAIFLSRQVLSKIVDLDVLCVLVTFVDELTVAGKPVVSVVATIDPKDPTSRTFKITRKPADGLAYAVAIARKYRLTYEQIRERLSL